MKQTAVVTHATHVNGCDTDKLHKSKLTFVSRIDFIRSKVSVLSAHVPGVPVTWVSAASAVS